MQLGSKNAASAVLRSVWRGRAGPECRRAAGYEREVAQGRSFLDVMPERVAAPISLDETRQAVNLSLDTRATALIWGGSDFEAKRLAGIATTILVRRSDQRSPGEGTPDPIIGRRTAARLAHLKSVPTALMETLRRATYALSPTPLRSYDHGYEFEAKYRTR